MLSFKSTNKIYGLLFAVILTVSIVLSIPASGMAESEEPVDIYTAEQFLAIKDEPYRSYILMRDIDFAGRSYTPFEFNGSLDGNGYAVLNLSVKSFSEATRKVYDGNMKEYDTHFAGLFSILDGANVNNLIMAGTDINISSDSEPVFAGSIAGYMTNSVISYCSSTDARLTVTSGAKCHGAGGFCGYGDGVICNSAFKGELISVDTDKSFRDEEFLGGAYAAGCINLESLSVELEGYISDHGFVHSGGLVGMYIHHIVPDNPYITNNTVEGAIHFFEDNTNRRAYCTGTVGEMMTWALTMGNNKTDFTRDETFEYDKNLYPHECSNPVYTKNETGADYNAIGYTEYNCSSCGYTYNSDFRPRLVKLNSATAAVNRLALDEKTSTAVAFSLLPSDAYIEDFGISCEDGTVAELVSASNPVNGVITAEIKGLKKGETEIILNVNGADYAGISVTVNPVFPVKTALAVVFALLIVLLFIALAVRKRQKHNY